MQRAEEQAREAGQGQAEEHVLLVLSRISNIYYVLSIPQAYFPKRSLSNNDTTFALAIGDSPPPIVSAEELVGAKNLRPNHPGSGIIQISPSTVVKFGHQVDMSEAETMHLLARKVPGVPIPKLNNAYSIAGVGYIVMGKAFGRVLGINGESQKRCGCHPTSAICVFLVAPIQDPQGIQLRPCECSPIPPTPPCYHCAFFRVTNHEITGGRNDSYSRRPPYEQHHY